MHYVCRWNGYITTMPSLHYVNLYKTETRFRLNKRIGETYTMHWVKDAYKNSKISVCQELMKHQNIKRFYTFGWKKEEEETLTIVA